MITLLSRLVCGLWRHDFIPVAWVTCNSADRGFVCKRCYTEPKAGDRRRIT